MTRKTLTWLLAALVVLLGLAYFTGAFDTNISTVEVPDLDLAVDDLEQVRLAGPTDTLDLRRTGGGWRMTAPVDAPADSVTVAQLLRDLRGLELDAVVSTNPERYAAYGVDSAATTLALTGPGGTRTLIVGDQGPDFRSAYVRLADDPRIFVTRGRLAPPDDPDRWRDKAMLSLAPSTVESVTVESQQGTYTARRGPDGWAIQEGGTTAPADSAAVARWLRRFAPLQANGFFDAAPRFLLRDEPDYRLILRTASGADTLSLLAFEEAYAATTGAGSPTYQIRSNRVGDLVPEPATLQGE